MTIKNVIWGAKVVNSIIQAIGCEYWAAVFLQAAFLCVLAPLREKINLAKALRRKALIIRVEKNRHKTSAEIFNSAIRLRGGLSSMNVETALTQTSHKRKAPGSMGAF